MKVRKNQVFNCTGINLKFDTVKLYKQGNARKAWLNKELVDTFLADYKFDLLIAATEENSGALILFKITNQDEFEKVFKFSNQLRQEAIKKLKQDE